MFVKILGTSNSGSFSLPQPNTRDKSFPVPRGITAKGGSGYNQIKQNPNIFGLLLSKHLII